MTDSGMETQTIESIEFKVDDNPDEEHISIDIEQVEVTDETHVVKSGSDEELKEKDELVVITAQDLAGMSDYVNERSTDISVNHDKVYEEWIYVDVNKSTYEVKENLLLLSSVYGNGYQCCSVM